MNNDHNASRHFETIYHKFPEHTAFTPYRVCPLGAHSDHQLGKITGFAIDKGIHIAYGPKMNGVVEISSLQFSKRAQWHVSETPSEKQGDWADHLRGATIALNSRYPLRTGLCAVLDGELPIGGLSSSAAVIITFLSALCHLNGIILSAKELIEISKEAENKYVGVSCGKLDQSCEVYCRKDHLLYMDMRDDSYELIPTAPSMKPFEIAIFFSGLNARWQAPNSICVWTNAAAPPMRSKHFQGWSMASLKKPIFVMCRMKHISDTRTSYPKTGQSVPSIGIPNSIAWKRVPKHGERAISKNSASFPLKADTLLYITGRQALPNS